MKILRQKEFGLFGFGKKKEPQQKPTEYKCPSISDLPSNIQSSLRGVERVWKKPEVQKLLDELGQNLDSTFKPFYPIVDQKMVEHTYKTYIADYLQFQKFPEETMMYPLMWDTCRYDRAVLLCYDINTGKFWYLNEPDYDFEEATKIRVLRDFIKNSLENLDTSVDPDLIRKIKKAFWI